jgi:spoIIIJ-associated protein
MPFDYDYEVNRAIEYLDAIFEGIHVSADMTAEPSEDGFLINIESDDSGILIGHRGETLDAVQYLLNLYINKGRGAYIRVAVDVENYKKKREAALIRLAGQMADKVVRLKRNMTMDAMNSYERRIVHSVLQNHPRVETYSVGEDPNRKVVVTLKNRGGYSSR